MNDTVNSDGNLFGRFVALVLIAGVAFAAHRLACGSACFMKMSCCPSVVKPAETAAPEAAPFEAPKPKAKPKVLKPIEKPVEKPLETALPPQTPAE